MPRKRILIISAACLLMAIGVVAFWPREREPEYNGKKLSEWLEVYRNHGFGRSPERLSANAAIQQIGTNALPWLVRWVNYDMPAWKEKLLQSKYSRCVPRFAMHSIVKPVLRHQDALVGFEVLGTTAGPAAPGLARILDNYPKISWMQALAALRGMGADALPPLYSVATNRAKPLQVRRGAMSSLGMLRGLGTNEHWLVTAIIPYLSEEDMAESTARALGGMSLAPDIAVPALRKTLASKNPEVRVWAIVALGHFHSQASSAVPELGRALVDSDPRVRQEAMNALERIKWGTAVTNGAKGF